MNVSVHRNCISDEEHTSSDNIILELPKVKTEPDAEIVKEEFFEAEDTDEISSNIATETDVPSLDTVETSVDSKNISIDDNSINEEVNITNLEEEVPEELMTKQVKEVVDKQHEKCLIDDDTKKPLLAEISENKIINDEEALNVPNSSASSQLNNSIHMENTIPEKKNYSEMTNLKHEVVAPENIVAKFDDLNLDDAEIAKLLDELEVDEELNFETTESQTKDNFITDVNIKITEDRKNCDSNDQTSFQNCKDEIREQVGVQVEKHETSVDSGKEKFSTQDITSNIPEVEQLQHIESDFGSKVSQEDESSNETIEEIISEIKEPIAVKTSEENDRPNNEDNAENQSRESNESDNNRNVVTECENPIEKDSSQDSLFRPQDLSIRTEVDESKRNIDLIGEPGSTPFNNVYIDKEIARVHESDSDSSTSTSPTFSDGSNTASTASTEEIQDENDKNKVAELDVSKSSKKPSATESAETDADHRGGGDSSPIEMSEESVTEPVPSKSTSPSFFNERSWLGKEAPLWIPDADATSCLHCDSKFTVLKRRHHCRACGLVLCSKCCNLRFRWVFHFCK